MILTKVQTIFDPVLNGYEHVSFASNWFVMLPSSPASWPLIFGSASFVFAMGRASELTSEERSAILALHRAKIDGMNPGKIAKVVNRSRSSVRYVIASGSASKRPTRRGRKAKITSRGSRQVVRAILSGCGGAKKARDALQMPVSVRTVQRNLKKYPWLKYVKIRSSPWLRPRHVKARLRWAQEHDGLDAFWWANVLFSDEKKWNLDGPDGMRRRWVDTRQPKHFSIRRHSGGGSVMIWAGFCGAKKTELKFLEGGINSAAYISTLATHLQPVIDRSTQIFQQDNAPCHSSRMTKRWLSDHAIEVLPWPALSPDLNPIENVWGYLTHVVYCNGKQYDSTSSLKAAIVKAWNEMPDSLLSALVQSMPKRVSLLLKCRGSYISY